jgi:hypothetical protein
VERTRLVRSGGPAELERASEIAGRLVGTVETVVLAKRVELLLLHL